MSPQAARQAMQVGFGTEIRKGGLSANKITNIVSGNYRRLEVSDTVERDTRRNQPDRWQVYEDAYQKALRRQPALGYSWAQ